MDIIAASKIEDWEIASDILKAVEGRLGSMNASLWPVEKTTPTKLSEAYKFEELRFFELESERIGLVFLMDNDPYFWPEVEPGTSMFFHKLSLLPHYCGKGLGYEALELIRHQSLAEGYKWLRLDCDDRPALHRFYQGFGFSLVDIKPTEQYRVARYQLLISSSAKDAANATPAN